jgi:hypothetical protein
MVSLHEVLVQDEDGCDESPPSKFKSIQAQFLQPLQQLPSHLSSDLFLTCDLGECMCTDKCEEGVGLKCLLHSGEGESEFLERGFLIRLFFMMSCVNHGLIFMWIIWREALR